MAPASALSLLYSWIPSLYSTGVLLLLYLLYRVGLFISEIVRRARTPLSRLKGPPIPSWIAGSEMVLLGDEDAILVQRWAEAYGPSFRYLSLFGKWNLLSTDPRAIGHILNSTDSYERPAPGRKLLSEVLGDGILVTEGETHKRQRRILNPAFSAGQLRQLTPIFFEKAFELRDAWANALQSSASSDGIKLDVVPWLNRLTLDIIGLAGFGYSFEALSNSNNELASAFDALMRGVQQFGLTTLLRLWMPVLSYIIPARDSRLTKTSLETMRRTGRILMQKKKAEAAQEYSSAGEGRDKDSLGGRDLLSTLIRANMAPDLSPAHRLSDKEVLDQITTFLLAGHETTSNGVLWALHVLSQNEDIQVKLREEALGVAEATPLMDDLSALPYLDLFVREVMRLHAPVREFRRVAIRDDILPLMFPVVDRRGNTLHSIQMHSGDAITIPLLAINRSKFLWGADAHEFKPERFQGEKLPPGASAIPGVWSNSMAFSGGPRACIGFRFSIIEMKAILFTLVRAFIFEPADQTLVIKKKSLIVTRPIVEGQEEKGAQLPLLLRAVVGL